MSYNLLNYPGSDTTTRNPYFRTTFSSIQPDILVTQEIVEQVGVNAFYNSVLKKVSNKYAAGTFINSYDTDNAIFYDSTFFTFLANNPITTALRDINEFILKSKFTGDTIRIYSLHLKASSGSANEILRAGEADSLRKVTDNLPPNSNYIVCGDYNMQSSSELAFIKLLSQTNTGYFIDPLNLVGTWYNNVSFAPYHTQSPRSRQFGGGANGGMDDRFDMILMSQSIIDNGGITYVPGSYTAYGNDGLHFNDSINRPPNNAVGQTIANALHYSSDHIPVFALFTFDDIIPVEIILFNAIVINNDILLKWSTASETNNFGFNIERRSVKENKWIPIGFIPGNGTSTDNHSYEFYNYNLPFGHYEYRLKQIDNDGTFDYSSTISLDIYPPLQFSLEQNYPNPFNPNTTINYLVPEEAFVTIKVFDVLGNELSLLVNEIKQPGKYKILYSADDITNGFYFYQMRSRSFIQTKKMIYLK